MHYNIIMLTHESGSPYYLARLAYGCTPDSPDSPESPKPASVTSASEPSA